MLDATHFRDLLQIAKSLSKDNVGDAIVSASVYRSVLTDSDLKIRADEILKRIRDYSRGADVGWKAFENPIMPDVQLSDIQVWQLVAIVGTLMELNYCFERVEEASLFTFENSAPVRYYVNGIFHYLSTLFLLDIKENTKKGYRHPGTLIKVFQPLGLDAILEPIFRIFDRPFGEEISYGGTILAVRNKGFVHGTFSPENIKRIVKDSHIFSASQRILFIQNHWDLFDQLVILRLRCISILTYLNVDLENEYSKSKLYYL